MRVEVSLHRRSHPWVMRNHCHQVIPPEVAAKQMSQMNPDTLPKVLMVILAKGGIQVFRNLLDPSFHRGDRTDWTDTKLRSDGNEMWCLAVGTHLVHSERHSLTSLRRNATDSPEACSDATATRYDTILLCPSRSGEDNAATHEHASLSTLSAFNSCLCACRKLQGRS
jgi:hypothetical protein